MPEIIESLKLNSTKFGDQKIEIILIVFLFTSILAVLFQLFIMIFYIKYIDLKLRKNFPYRLILLLAFSDIIVWGMRIESNIERIASGHTAYYYSENYCAFLGCMWNFFLLINILTTFTISSCLFLEVFNYKSGEYEKYFYVFCFVYSLIFTLLPLVENDAYGEDDGIKCWITDHYYSIFRFLGFYAHLWLVFILNCFILFIILWKFRDLEEVPKKIVKKLVWFPLIMLIFWTEPSIRRIANAKDDDFSLAVLQYIFMPMQGAANAVVYGLVHPEVKEKIGSFFTCKCCYDECLNKQQTQSYFLMF